MSWERFGFGGGVVVSRPRSGLQVGEMSKCANAKYKLNDPSRLWQDDEFFRQSGVQDTTIVFMGIMPWESETDQVCFVAHDGANTGVYTMPVGSTVITSRQAITGIVTSGQVIHRGDQNFVVTDKGNFIFTNSTTVFSMGMVPNTAAISATRVAGTGAALQSDVYVYLVTEFDSVNNVESPITTNSANILHPLVSVDGEGFTISVSAAYVKANPRADKLKLYRQFTGNDSAVGTTAAQQLGLDIANGKFAFTGGFVSQIDAVAGASFPNDPIASRLNPQLQISKSIAIIAGQVSITSYFTQPENARLGTVFQDSMNLVKASGGAIGYSHPQDIEYQPVEHNLIFAGDRSDKVYGLALVDEVMVVLMEGSVWAVSQLTFSGVIRELQGQSRSQITSSEGCVGREAWEVVETDNGKVVVWLSTTGLRMANRRQMADACPDWTVEGSGLRSDLISGAVLVKDQDNHRLRLFATADSGEVIWDFYYKNLKNERMRCLGPHVGVGERIVSGASGVGTDGIDALWVAGSTFVYLLSRVTISETASVELPYFWSPTSDMADLVVDAIGVKTVDGDGSELSITASAIDEEGGLDSQTMSPAFALGGQRVRWEEFADGVRGKRMTFDFTVTPSLERWGIEFIEPRAGESHGGRGT